jgi:hypothetical protein
VLLIIKNEFDTSHMPELWAFYHFALYTVIVCTLNPCARIPVACMVEFNAVCKLCGLTEQWHVVVSVLVLALQSIICSPESIIARANRFFLQVL